MAWRRTTRSTRSAGAQARIELGGELLLFGVSGPEGIRLAREFLRCVSIMESTPVSSIPKVRAAPSSGS